MGLERSWRFHEVLIPRFQDSWYIEVVRLLATRTGSPTPQEIFLILISVTG